MIKYHTRYHNNFDKNLSLFMKS